jgi:prepilin-type N-terminal cleavage/methylation domain-containing protein
MRRISSQKGFTLVEILIVLALIAILVGAVLVALNPGRQFANARNSTRYSHVNTIMNAISSNAAENNGVFTCASAGSIPATATNMGSDTAAGDYDIAPCLVTEYLSSMPVDPSDATASWTSETSYSTGYSIAQDASTNAITVSAPTVELSETISVTR